MTRALPDKKIVGWKALTKPFRLASFLLFRACILLHYPVPNLIAFARPLYPPADGFTHQNIFKLGQKYFLHGNHMLLSIQNKVVIANEPIRLFLLLVLFNHSH